jgi:hypothetical protein
MPIEELEEWLEAANRIESRERYALIADLQAGSGTLKKADVARHVGHLKRQFRDARPLDTQGTEEMSVAGVSVSRAKGKRVRMVERG